MAPKRKELTERQKRKIAWLKTHGGLDHIKDGAPAKPKLEKKPSPKKDPKVVEIEKRKQAEGAARGFKRKIDVGQNDNTAKKSKIEAKASDNSDDSDSGIDDLETTKQKSSSEDNTDNIGEMTEAKPAMTVRDILGIAEKVKDEKKKKKKEKKKHYVLFVGNLPYDISDGDLAHHFIQAGEVKDVRKLSNEKGPKGCAFLEFYTEKAHKAALMLHHTEIDKRIINVEFTAPGRKNKGRDDNLKKKNEKAKRFKMGQGVSVRKNRPVQQGKLKVKSKLI